MLGNFTGIRLIIAYEPSNLLRDVVSLSVALGTLQLIQSTKYVTDRDYVRCLISSIKTRSDRQGDSLRTQLDEQRRSIKLSQLLLEKDDPSSSHLCTVVFQLVPTGRKSSYRFDHLQPNSFTRLLPINLSMPPNTAGLRVAYDRTHPCTQDSHSVFSFLQIYSHEIYGPNAAPKPAGKCGNWMRTAVMPVTMYSLRILPTSNEARRPFPQLPPEVLLLIGKYVVTEPSKSRWRKKLLSVALVCRSWAHLVNLFFQLLDDCKDEEEKPSPAGMAQSLKLRPQQAALVRIFSPFHYKGCGHEKKSSLPSWRELLKILTSLETCVEEVALRAGVHRDVLADSLQALSRLQKVKRLKIMSHFPTQASRSEDRPFNILADVSILDI